MNTDDISKLTTNALNGFHNKDPRTVDLVPHLVDAVERLKRSVSLSPVLPITGNIALSVVRCDRVVLSGRVCNWTGRATMTIGNNTIEAESESDTPTDAMIRAAQVAIDTLRLDGGAND